LALVRWTGAYREVEAIWLRWATLEGELLPTAQELAQQERRRADAECRRVFQATQQAEAEHRQAIEAIERAENLAARLRELGVNPDNL
jgi:hypothetical protein